MGYEGTLTAAKRASTAQLLMRCARLVNELSLTRVEAMDLDGWRPRPAHTTLFPHIDLEGTRLTELAQRVGITKQAVGQLVDDLERVGMVERIPDPADGRAKLVVWTDRGRRGLLEGLEVLGGVERELAQVMGAERWRVFHEALLLLDDHLSGDASPSPRDGS